MYISASSLCTPFVRNLFSNGHTLAFSDGQMQVLGSSSQPGSSSCGQTYFEQCFKLYGKTVD